MLLDISVLPKNKSHKHLILISLHVHLFCFSLFQHLTEFIFHVVIHFMWLSRLVVLEDGIQKENLTKLKKNMKGRGKNV